MYTDIHCGSCAPATTVSLRVLAVGDPAYASTGSHEARNSNSTTCLDRVWQTLPGSRREVAALARQLPAATHLTTLLGAEASKSRVLAALLGQHVIHLATHGLRRGSECGDVDADSRGVALVPKERDDGESEPDGIGMLALAATTDDEPLARYLSETDIAALALEPAQWVVLSACDTGLGDSRA